MKTIIKGKRKSLSVDDYFYKIEIKFLKHGIVLVKDRNCLILLSNEVIKDYHNYCYKDHSKKIIIFLKLFIFNYSTNWFIDEDTKNYKKLNNWL
jgi:hypothetical protein